MKQQEKKVDFDKVVLAEVDTSTNGAPLGYLCWTTVQKGDYPREDIRQALEDSRMGEKNLPRKISAVNAFKRASKEAEINVKQEDGIRHNYLVRDVSNDDDKIIRHLVKEVRDSVNVKLDHESVAIFKFDKKNGDGEDQFRSALINDDGVADEQVEDAHVRYEKYLTHHNDAHIRAIVRAALHQAKALLVRESGGVYFVPFEEREKLFNLQTFLEIIDCSAKKLKVIDDVDGQEMMTNALEENIEDTFHECKRMVATSDAIPKAKVQAQMEKARSFVKNYSLYKEKIKSETDKMDEMVNHLKDVVGDMLDKMDDN